jgi:hypothetical protein
MWLIGRQDAAVQANLVHGLNLNKKAIRLWWMAYKQLVRG